MSEGHQSVLLNETLELLAQGSLSQGRARVLDCTFGGGGHTQAILDKYPDCELTAIDTDPEAAQRAKALSAQYAGRFTFVDANFGELPRLMIGDAFDAVLFDLGVSSYHFDTPGRGFSFRFDAPLDMRMNPREGRSAAEFLETASRDELVHAVREYGEEARWRRVVQMIEEARGSGVLARTTSFVSLLERALGAARPGRIHPATKVFQGVRIAVNGEMASIESALPAAFELLRPSGVMAVISFHSLEDRLVKRYFRSEAGMPLSREDNAPQQSRQKRAELLNNRPITASAEELERNPRARSAKLRALRKL
ncbi:MAG: 16S rRNA (cytosine(1402)-N(4))-methyltransferase RsmH [Opitutales bacterium]|nr:16S rRNA (cytosine(1402)-N(4))-methyltransferase RsmH [Opitutales bacterium]